jgi:RNA polymerase sigma factor (sigma-70 family)
MDEAHRLTGQFEADRPRLQAAAYRMLGSRSEAEDAVQEAWIRLSRSEAGGIENVGAWLTTVVARVCLDMLRSRRSRGEEPLGPRVPERVIGQGDAFDAEHEMVLAESVGLALLVVLEALAPAERVAFVLHDMFGLPFDDIAPIVGRTSTATRQLASRARRRVRGGAVSSPDRARQAEVVRAYLAASRAGDFDALLAVLHPEAVLRLSPAISPANTPLEVRGAADVARRVLAFPGRARAARPALVDGAVGVVVAPRGRLFLVLRLRMENERIAEIEVVADPAQLAELELSVLGDEPDATVS